MAGLVKWTLEQIDRWTARLAGHRPGGELARDTGSGMGKRNWLTMEK